MHCMSIALLGQNFKTADRIDPWLPRFHANGESCWKRFEPGVGTIDAVWAYRLLLGADRNDVSVQPFCIWKGLRSKSWSVKIQAFAESPINPYQSLTTRLLASHCSKTSHLRHAGVLDAQLPSGASSYVNPCLSIASLHWEALRQRLPRAVGAVLHPRATAEVFENFVSSNK